MSEGRRLLRGSTLVTAGGQWPHAQRTGRHMSPMTFYPPPPAFAAFFTPCPGVDERPNLTRFGEEISTTS